MAVLHNKRKIGKRDKRINKRALISENEKRKAVKKVHQVYDELLERVKLFANTFGPYSYSKRYWEIILGKIIMGQVSHIYERILVLKKIDDRIGELSVDCVSPESYAVPNKTIYHKDLCSEWLEAQYYSQATLAIDINSSYKHVNYDLLEKSKEKNNKVSVAKKFLKKLWSNLVRKPKVGLRGAQFDSKDILRMGVCTKLNIDQIEEVKKLMDTEELKANNKKRREIENLFGKNRLHNCVLNALSYNIPKLYLEGHNERLKQLHKSVSIDELPEHIISARTSYPPFLLLKAEAAKQGKKIFSIQHGGGYGEVNSSAEKHERSVSDRFITWGWKKEHKDTPMPSPKILSNKKSDYTSNNKVLWITRSLSHYSDEILNETLYKKLLVNEPEKFLKYQTKFYESLSVEAKKDIYIRFKSSLKQKSKINNKWRQKVVGINNTCKLPEKVNIAESSTNMIKQSKQYGLRVVDHFGSTSFLQFIGLDMPVIIFSDIEYKSISDMARMHYMKLENVGIFHRTAKSAAAKVNKVRHDVEAWWRGKKRREAINKFSELFAWSPDDRYKRWCKMINNL